MCQTFLKVFTLLIKEKCKMRLKCVMFFCKKSHFYIILSKKSLFILLFELILRRNFRNQNQTNKIQVLWQKQLL